MSITLVFSLIGLVGGPLIAYFGVVRRASGKIATSEAGQLWKESAAIRDWATNRIDTLNATVERLERQVTRLEGRNEKLYLENGNLTKMLEEHSSTISELRDQIHRLADDNTRLREENDVLRARLDELEGANGGGS